MKDLAIIDCTCSNLENHNVQALVHFSNEFKEFEISSEIFICKSYSESVINSKIASDFNQYFSPLKLESSKETSSEVFQTNLNELSTLLKADFSSFFFLNIDFVSLTNLTKFLEENPTFNKKLFIRFIGVMEFWGQKENEVENLCSLLKRNKAVFQKENCVFYAETKKYGKFLQSETGIFFDSLPYPKRKYFLNSEKIKNKNSNTKVISFLGKPRKEKGYFEIYDIVNELIESLPQEEYRFVIQRMSKDFKHFDQSYERSLDSLRRSDFYKGNLDIEKMYSLIAASDLVILPYDSQVYRLRGSAIMYDASAFGIPIASYSGSAFSNEVEEYDLGVVSDEKYSLVESIVSFLSGEKKLKTPSFEHYQKKQFEKLAAKISNLTI